MTKSVPTEPQTQASWQDSQSIKSITGLPGLPGLEQSLTGSNLESRTTSASPDWKNEDPFNAATKATSSITAALEAITSGTSLASSEGISDGAVAGVAIGCLIAGLALGVVAAFILFRRRQRNSSTSPGFVAVESQYAEPKNGPQVNVIPSGNDVELDQFLLDTIPDKEIQAELSALSELIYQHVENHYHGPDVQTNAAEVAQGLANIDYSPDLSRLQSEEVASLCLAPKTFHIGLRHVLSHTIFRSLDFNSGGNLSMLPLPIAAMARDNHSDENTDNPAITLARSRWRSLSALLLHPNPMERTPLPVSTDEAPSKAYSLANKLNNFLQLFVAQDHASQQEQTSHLQALILECTKLGFVLLSQPDDWNFVFSHKPATMDRTNRIVVCPGLERLSHNDGTRYKSAKEAAAPETIPL